MDPLVSIAFFVVGLAFGSFLNVCISRIPHDISIISPRSRCPFCNTPIAWRDNIPLLSWALQRAHCRACGNRISLRYPAVELLTAVAFVGSYGTFGATAATLRACVFCFLIIGLIFMDAETGLLPAEFTYPGFVIGLIFAWLVPLDTGGTHFLMWYFNLPILPATHLQSLVDALVAIIVGAGFFYLAWAIYYLVRKRAGLGFGDIALLAMVGAFLGLKATVLVIFLAPVMGSLYAIVWMLTRRKDHPIAPPPAESVLTRSIPFGVFLGASALIALFFSHAIWQWYLELFQ